MGSQRWGEVERGWGRGLGALACRRVEAYREASTRHSKRSGRLLHHPHRRATRQRRLTATAIIATATTTANAAAAAATDADAAAAAAAGLGRCRGALPTHELRRYRCRRKLHLSLGEEVARRQGRQGGGGVRVDVEVVLTHAVRMLQLGAGASEGGWRDTCHVDLGW